MSSRVQSRFPVLADTLPASAVRNVALVIGAVLFTALAAQVAVPLPFTPVPISGQTFAVLLSGAAIGPKRATLAMAGYLILGAAGLPFFADGQRGINIVFGATGGYLVGFIVAAALVGALAKRGFGRTPGNTLFSFLAGSIVIYLFGAPRLAVVADVSMAEAVRLGVLPFLVGDVIKALLAGALLPITWRLIGEKDIR